MAHDYISRVRLHKGTRWRVEVCPVYYVPHPKSPLAPIGGRFTALNGSDGATTGRRGSKTPPGWPKITPKRVRSAPWSRANGFRHFALRPGGIGARMKASWAPCDPLGLRLWPVCRLFAGVMTQG